MDTTEVATLLGTTPRNLRQFLRSPYSTFVQVGSGARYQFDESDLPTIEKRFRLWQSDGKPRPAATVDAQPKPRRSRPSVKTTSQDEEVWASEAPVQLEDIRNPRVRARVKRDAEAAENRLNQLLLAKGLHITQGRIDARRRAS